ncbi:MAG: AAA family ATPase [Candidatus Omnitrophica bacterium]|nr:AAA family ATPase [Candidatus Omnitrophota bacterium]
MAYHTLLGFKKEPFSTSPDPQFFYLTKEHDMALTSILIELRLRRGLTVILGDIGTGKTTLSRKLVQELKDRGNMIFHMILNPNFETEEQFLTTLLRNFDVEMTDGSMPDMENILELRDAVEKFLIQKAQEKQTIILIVDEAQKLNLVTLEVLRILLNFETNEYKLIQLVLLGQLELYSKLVSMPNFIDRVSFKYTLNPLDLEETKGLIHYRIQQAGYQGHMQLFNDEAISEIYNYSRGYPRHITMLCHKVLKELILQNREVVDRDIILSVLEKERRVGWGRAESFRRGNPTF